MISIMLSPGKYTITNKLTGLDLSVDPQRVITQTKRKFNIKNENSAILKTVDKGQEWLLENVHEVGYTISSHVGGNLVFSDNSVVLNSENAPSTTQVWKFVVVDSVSDGYTIRCAENDAVVSFTDTRKARLEPVNGSESQTWIVKAVDSVDVTETVSELIANVKSNDLGAIKSLLSQLDDESKLILNAQVCILFYKYLVRFCASTFTVLNLHFISY